jgi:hypothetical protein
MTASTTNDGAEVAVVRRFIDEVINGGQLDLVDELWSKDLDWHGGSLGETHGLASYKAFPRAAAEGAFSGMHLTVHDVVPATGQEICVLPGRLTFWEARGHDRRLRE